MRLAKTIGLMFAAAATAAATGDDPLQHTSRIAYQTLSPRDVGHHEAPSGTWAPPSVVAGRPVTAAAGDVIRGNFVSVQVNVNPDGNNVVGDAANEPSIAVDPTNPARMAIGWPRLVI